MLAIESPLVSIIITTYNHANYIPKAIHSCLNQTYSNFEVIIIDDGSTDDTKIIMESFPNIIYYYQNNAGLSNARNSGVSVANGKYVLFLDADDWLFPRAIETNLKYHLQNDDLAFVSGNHFKIFITDNYIRYYEFLVKENHYLHLLKGNYIGMHATVMYNKEIFNELSFDPFLRTCEDYDMYLRIAKNHKVLHHTEFIAAYRLHSSNMSINYKQMLKDSLHVLSRQLDGLKTKDELNHYQEGRKGWINMYTQSLYWQKLKKNKKANLDEIVFLLQYKPNLFFRYIYNYILKR